MKLWHIKNVDEFFEVINKCKGNVFLVGEDIRLNLKSRLTQYFSLAAIFSGGEEIPELELELEDPSDIDLLIKFAVG